MATCPARSSRQTTPPVRWSSSRVRKTVLRSQFRKQSRRQKLPWQATHRYAYRRRFQRQRPTSVSIVPAQAVVAIGSTTQLKAIATFNDGSTKDVTTEFAWTSSGQPAPSQLLLPGRFQAWPRVKRSSPAATRGYKPQPRPPAPSARWSGAARSSSPKAAPTPGTGKAPIPGLRRSR